MKTEDSAFDLDEILTFLYETVQNQDHRYFQLLTRLRSLRPNPAEHQRSLRSPLQPDSIDRELFVDIRLGYKNRFCHVSIDHARALFPVPDLK